MIKTIMTAIITIVTSFLALIISLGSFVIAKEKFRLDLYNRRFEIYLKTIKFYLFSIRRQEFGEAGNLALIRAEFIGASREARFLFSPESGVHNQLSDLNMKASMILRRYDHPEEFSQAEIRQMELFWDVNVGTLEEKMAPYLNYHYVSTASALADCFRARLIEPFRRRWPGQARP